jgi:hypothetical protein
MRWLKQPWRRQRLERKTESALLFTQGDEKWHDQVVEAQSPHLMVMLNETDSDIPVRG